MNKQKRKGRPVTAGSPRNPKRTHSVPQVSVPIRNVVDVYIMIACDLTYEDYKDCATLLEDALTDSLGNLRAHIGRKRADAMIQEDYDDD